MKNYDQAFSNIHSSILFVTIFKALNIDFDNRRATR